MKTLFAIIAIVLVIPACSILNPSIPEQLAIKAKDARLTNQNKFIATVAFDNKLGRQVNILNLGCMDNGHFIPNFVLQHSTGDQWTSLGAPGCVEIAVGPTTLANGSQFTTTVAMLTDTIPLGIYRLQFDIREVDMTKKLPEDNLFSNTFSIVH